MNKIAVIGTGYVGLVQGACLSDFGHNVICVDNDKKKIEDLRKGIIPIYEVGLKSIVEKNAGNKRLEFTTGIKSAIESSKVIFIAVGTPPTDGGSADLQYVKSVARDIGRYMNGYKVIVNKSTVPVGTGRIVQNIVRSELVERGVNYEFDVVSNPEFLREGSAVNDFINPDRIVIGTESDRARELMKQIYNFLYLKGVPFIETNIETAEMIKYASNAFLAMKVTFINEVANLCEKVSADVLTVAKAMGKDSRISPKFLNPGPGYGGSCFPKDTLALAQIANQCGTPITLVEATIAANERQKIFQAKRIIEVMGSLHGKTLAILGLSFKPNTSDMREAPSLAILNTLADAGALFRIYDPIALEEAKWHLRNLQDRITYCNDEYEAIEGSDGVVILTEWSQFCNLDLERVKASLSKPYFFDLRNIYKRSVMEGKGFLYYGVGQGVGLAPNIPSAESMVAIAKEE
jgi:UDPglucose 6-dehydrogenase